MQMSTNNYNLKSLQALKPARRDVMNGKLFSSSVRFGSVSQMLCLLQLRFKKTCECYQPTGY